MTELSMTSIDAGTSMARRPRRLPVSVSSVSARLPRMPATVTRSSNCVAGRRISRRTGEPVATVTRDVTGANPFRVATRRYTPIGTSSNTKVPSGPVETDRPSSSSLTRTAARGVPPVSATTAPRTEPTGCPCAGRAASSPALTANTASRPIPRLAPRSCVLCPLINLCPLRHRLVPIGKPDVGIVCDWTCGVTTEVFLKC